VYSIFYKYKFDYNYFRYILTDMDYRYNTVSYDPRYYSYDEELLNSQLLTSYEDSLVPVLVPPEDDLVPILVPPGPTLVPPDPELLVIEVPVEVYIEVPVEVPNQQAQITHIPQYIFNGYIESLVTKKELCPILMNELTLASTCITPCNHAMSKEALDSWFETNESCPVCRTQFTMSQVQTYKK
jgi:hypothetical protein